MTNWFDAEAVGRGAGHDHSWAQDMDEVRACCPDFNPGLEGTGVRCPGDPGKTVAERDVMALVSVDAAYEASVDLQGGDGQLTMYVGDSWRSFAASHWAELTAQGHAILTGMPGVPVVLALPQDCPHPEAYRAALNLSGWLYQTCAACASERLTGDDTDDRERPPGPWSPILSPSHVPAGHLAAAGLEGAPEEVIDGYLTARWGGYKTTKEAA